ncbi:MAG: LysR family transcriptional regulator [Sporomusa sp.]|nr:LysR family transcriptional regulator [Sporomusa sp.]
MYPQDTLNNLLVVCGGILLDTLQIKYFTAVAQHLNFTEAAKQLYVAQPYLSKQIAMLERELNVQLFIRTKRSVRLTPAGAVLLVELNDISRRLDKALEKAQQACLGQAGSLSIGCLEALDLNDFFPPLIQAFRKDYPYVSLNLERHSFKALLDALTNRLLDVVITLSFEVKDRPGLCWETIYEHPGAIAMPVSHPLAKLERINIADLKDEPFIIISEQESPSGAAEFLDRHIRLHRNPLIQLIELDEDSRVGIVAAWKKDNMNPTIPLFINRLIDDAKTASQIS